MTRVTIGMPVRNGEAFVGEAIESLLGQSFGDFTLRISDNASTDSTHEICQRFAAEDSRVHVTQLPTDIGANANFNRVATGVLTPYFKWAAHDDVCESDFLRDCLEQLESDPLISGARPGTVLIGSRGRRSIPYDLRVDLADPDPVQRLRNLLLDDPMCFAVFGVFRANLVTRIRGLGAYYGADKVFLAHMVLSGQLVLIDKPSFHRRSHATQSSQMEARARKRWSDGLSGQTVIAARTLDRARTLAGYTRAITAARMSAATSLRAALAVGHFLLSREHLSRRNAARARYAIDPDVS